MSLESRLKKLEQIRKNQIRHKHFVPIRLFEGQTKAEAIALYERLFVKIQPDHEIQWVEVIDIRARNQEYIENKKREALNHARG
jgi:hypothetical protein